MNEGFPHPTRLPIAEILPHLHEALPRLRRVVVRAPTGSGKSTQVPQMLIDHNLCGPGCVVVLQPRRLAARMLARRVAAERHGAIGEEVGYHVRLDNRCGPRTRIRFETDGILLRQMIADPGLRGVSAIIFDEFHERHLQGDVMLGLATRLQTTERPDLSLVVMSATLDSRRIVDYLSPCELIESAGRQFPVDIEYLAKAFDADRNPVWDEAARHFDRLAAARPAGDVLVFMPGAYEIRRTVEAIRRTRAGRDFTVLPLHGELSPEQQDAAVGPCDRRKAIVSTNVAETSLTIEGVTVVIDSGLARKAKFDANRGINTLLVEKISRASADQRSGRAGRTSGGLCLRLWTEKDHLGRPAQELPESQSVDLSETVLALKACGHKDVAAFPWLDAPPEKMLARSLSLLADLGALDPGTQALTDLGRQLVSFPVHPRYARLLLAADHYGCVPEAALIAAVTSDRALLLRNRGSQVRDMRDELLGEENESDLLRLVHAWTYARDRDFDLTLCDELGISAGAARQAAQLLGQFLAIAADQGLDTAERDVSSVAVRKSVLCAFPDHLARRLSKGTLRYDVVHRRRGTLEAESVVRDADLIVASEMQEIENSRGDIDVRLSLATAVEQDWLPELFPRDLRRERTVFLDAAQKRVRAEERTYFRDLLLSAGHAAEPADEEAAELLAKEVVEGRLPLKCWDHAVEQWILRVNRLAEWCPELKLPVLSNEDRQHLIRQVCLGARNAKDIKDRPAMHVVRGWLSGEQRSLLDRHAPERITLENERTPRLTYDKTNAPFISLRIQELYGVTRSITIAMGRVRVLVHILAPNQRPVQITDDLESFWRTGYPQAKRELQRRYPKHEWR